MHRKLIYIGSLALLALTVLAYAKAQTTTPSSDQILQTVSDNLNVVRSVRVTGNFDSSVNTESISHNIIYRMTAPEDWINAKLQIGARYTGDIGLRSTPTATITTTTTSTNIGSRWQFIPYVHEMTTGTIGTTSTVGMATSSAISSIISEGRVYLSSPELRQTLIDNDLISSTSSEWVYADRNFLENFDRIMGTNSAELFDEKSDMVMNAVQNPEDYFRTQSFTSSTLNGRNVYKVDFTVTERFLNEFYPEVSTTNTTSSVNRTASGTLWIDQGSVLPSRLVFTAGLNRGTEIVDRFNLVTNFEDYDRAVDISIPRVVRTLESAISEILQNLSNKFERTETIPNPIPIPGPVPIPTTTFPRTSTGPSTP